VHELAYTQLLFYIYSFWRRFYPEQLTNKEYNKQTSDLEIAKAQKIFFSWYLVKEST